MSEPRCLREPWSVFEAPEGDVWIDWEADAGDQENPPARELLFLIGKGSAAKEVAEHIVAAHAYYIKYYGNTLRREEQFGSEVKK